MERACGENIHRLFSCLFRGFFRDTNNKIPSLRGFIVYWLEQLDSKKGYIIEKQRIFNEYKSPIYGDFFILQKIFENVKNVKVKIIRGFFGDFGKRD